MAGSVVLRPAAADDSHPLSALICRVLKVSSMADCGPDNIARVTAHFTPAGVVEMIARNHMLVAEHAGVLVGTAGIGATEVADVMG